MEKSQLSNDTSVLFITIDSLRSDAVIAEDSVLMPFLSRIFKENTTLSNCFSVGNTTQFSFPGLMSSTLPLDYGGYEYGVRNRPKTAAETFEEAGYQTGGFVTASWLCPMYGYDRGFEIFCPLVDINDYIKKFLKIYLRYGNMLIDTKGYPEDFAAKKLVPLVGDFFEYLEQFIDGRKTESEGRVNHPAHLHPRIHSWDFKQALSVAVRAQTEFQEHPINYTKKSLAEYPDPVVISQLYEARNPHYRNSHKLISNTLLNIRQLRQWLNLYQSLFRIQGLVGSGSIPERTGNTHWVKNTLTYRTASGAYVLQNLRAWIEEQKPPYFAWAHLFDIHDKNLFSWENIDSNLLGNELFLYNSHLSNLSPSLESSKYTLRQSMSVRYVDYILKHFFEEINETYDEHPLIVLTADHGKRLPSRSGDPVNQFFDEQIHVPVAFIHPDLDGQSFDGLCSSIDIVPTVLDLLGYDSPNSFSGVPVRTLPQSGREYVIAEDLGRGKFDPDLSPARICVRSNEEKIIYTEYINKIGDTTVECAVDLTVDPFEQNQIEFENLPPEFESLRSHASARIDEVRRSLKPDHYTR